MSESYDPDTEANAVPDAVYTSAFRSQRDLGLQVPINFVTKPGVSFSAACFSDLSFEDDDFGACSSELLALGFRRFEIDLYWDQVRQLWSFCPAAIPSVITATPQGTETLTYSTGTAQSDSSTSANTSSVPLITPRQETLPAAALSTSRSLTGSLITTPVASTAIAATAAATSLGSTNPLTSAIPDTNDDPLVKVGPYLCTTTINLSTFSSLLLSYIQDTQNTLHAQILYVIINIHAAAADSSPYSPAPSPTTLPSPANLVGYQIDVNLSSYLYTPTHLRSDRANLNQTWFSVPSIHRPADGYYETSYTPNKIATSENGWPTEYYAEFEKGRRLLLGWGSVDPQLSDYNFTADDAYVFPSGYIQSLQKDVTSSSSGVVTDGCFFQKNVTDLSLSRLNSSWASEANFTGFDFPISATSDLIPLLNLTTNTTNCGISPLLNVTLLDASTQEDPFPYRDYAYATIWSWAPNEPKLNSSSVPSTLFRCATTNLDLGGRWTVSDCSQKYYSACRASSQPYNWTIADYTVSYSYASQSCPDDYTFGAPRTALENSYLTQAIRDSHRDYDGHGVWVDFNSLDYEDCWVSGGPNATCPYVEGTTLADDLKRQTVLVPAIAALIVIVIFTITLVGKYAGNRSSRKQRRQARKKAENGFIYEGVPS